MNKLKLVLILLEQYNLRNRVNYALLIRDNRTYVLQGEGETKINSPFTDLNVMIEYLTNEINISL